MKEEHHSTSGESEKKDHHTETGGEAEYEEEEEGKVASDEERNVFVAALRKYELFEQQCGDLLDPELKKELELMKSLGLPTMLINNYGDIEEEEEEEVSKDTPTTTPFSRYIYYNIHNRPIMLNLCILPHHMQLQSLTYHFNQF